MVQALQTLTQITHGRFFRSGLINGLYFDILLTVSNNSKMNRLRWFANSSAGEPIQLLTQILRDIINSSKQISHPPAEGPN